MTFPFTTFAFGMVLLFLCFCFFCLLFFVICIVFLVCCSSAERVWIVCDSDGAPWLFLTRSSVAQKVLHSGLDTPFTAHSGLVFAFSGFHRSSLAQRT